MRAVGAMEFGGPEQMRVLDLPEPHPGPGEVRIRVHAAAINPSDIGLRGKRFSPSPDWKPPYVFGMDAAGVVSEVGEGVTWQVGDAVMAVLVPWSAGGGADADEVVVPAASVVPVPSGMDFVHASTLPMNALTAYLVLEKLALPEGSTLAVTGAAGAFGGYVVQLAKAQGLRVLADVSEADEELARELGVDDVVRRGEGVAERYRALVPDGVDAVADGALLNAGINGAVKDGGQIVVPAPWLWETERGITLGNVFVQDRATDTAALESLLALAEKGALTPRVADVFPAEQVVAAHRRFEAGGVRGRLVLDFSS